ncbi:hypothetical protein JNB63_01990 [Microbacterium trichothecenolyticum]|uniref:hypothetical protein n=1 Tax=Microbacterium trichothecenolyticum TaxID=69370 RepID=UPI001C6DDE56|nr:hypothetical protein [Microbacterium trichothecenolyticum]MBW9118856.1 hypothetical protein [Microbacterium trichothecenolyticum]
MTNDAFPDEAAFCAAVVLKMRDEGRKWAWLASAVGASVQTLRNQLAKPHTLTLWMALRIARALSMPLWQFADDESEAVAS